MKVYRYVAEEELVAILSGHLDDVGSEYNRKEYKRQNNHRYKPNTKYLHFFKDKSSIELIRREILHKDKDGVYFFCSFDIPATILWRYAGKGNYDGSYKVPYHTVREYAIPMDTFDPKWIQRSIVDDRQSHNGTAPSLDDIKSKRPFKSEPWGYDLDL